MNDTNMVPVVLLFYHSATDPMGQGLLIYEVSRSHSKTHHSR
jgi:hypothetical protein